MTRKSHKSFKINEHDNKSPFIIPEGYLDTLPENLMQKIQVERKKDSSRLRKIMSIVKPQLAFAGGFIALALIIYSAISLILSKEKTFLTKDNNNHKAMIEYASYQLDENILYEYLEGNADINGTHTNEDLSDLMIDYLVRENIDYGSLLEL